MNRAAKDVGSERLVPVVVLEQLSTRVRPGRDGSTHLWINVLLPNIGVSKGNLLGWKYEIQSPSRLFHVGTMVAVEVLG